jgi:tetratricopeptide (TPR) repeat protein
MFRFGNLLQQRRSYARSTEIFRQRLANCSDSLDSRLYMLIGNNFFADSLVDSAIAQYELSLQKEPENGFVLTRLAETSQIKGDETRARALYGQVIAKASMEGAKKEDISAGMSASLKLNSLDYAAKNWAQIVERSTTMLKLDPANKGLMLYTAIGYQGLGNKDSACKWYKELLKLDPANEAAKKNMAALGC